MQRYMLNGVWKMSDASGNVRESTVLGSRLFVSGFGHHFGSRATEDQVISIIATL